MTNLMTLGKELQVDEVVIPDVLSSCNATINLIRQFEVHAIGTDYEGWRPKFMGVAQGRTLAEIMKCMHYLEGKGWVSTLALPRIMNYNIHRQARSALAESLAGYGSRFSEAKAIHCLGSSSWIREVVVLGEIEGVRSMDTSLPVVLGLEGISVHANIHQARRPDFFDRTIPRASKEWEITYDNCTTFREWAGARSPFTEETSIS